MQEVLRDVNKCRSVVGGWRNRYVVESMLCRQG
jgi:hypothetical protein